MRAPAPTSCKVKNFYLEWSLIDTIIIIIIIIVLSLYQVLPVNLQLTVPEK